MTRAPVALKTIVARKATLFLTVGSIGNTTPIVKPEKWTRAHRLTLVTIAIGLIGVTVAVFSCSKSHSQGQSPIQDNSNGANGNVNHGGTQINNGGNGNVINNSPGATLNQASPDLIEGTQYTEKELLKFFPFGYVLFFYGQGHIMRNQFVNTGLTEWKFDPEKVVIDLDIPHGLFTCTIPNVATKPSDSGPKIFFDGTGTFKVQARFVAGFAKQAGFQFGAEPVMYVMVLSDNQRAPVLAVGARIPSADEPAEMIVRP